MIPKTLSEREFFIVKISKMFFFVCLARFLRLHSCVLYPRMFRNLLRVIDTVHCKRLTCFFDLSVEIFLDVILQVHEIHYVVDRTTARMSSVNSNPTHVFPYSKQASQLPYLRYQPRSRLCTSCKCGSCDHICVICVDVTGSAVGESICAGCYIFAWR